MAKTRGSSGITVPRLSFTPTASPLSRQPKATKKRTTPAKKPAKSISRAASRPAANSSQPRTKKATDKTTTTGRVTKPKAAPKKTKKAPGAATPATKNKRDPSVLDKIAGVAEKIVGAVEGKPGKKAAGTKKIRGTDGKGATRAKKE